MSTSSEQLIQSEIMSQFFQRSQESQQQPECCHCDTVMVNPAFKCIECQVFLCSGKCKERHFRQPICKCHQILPYSKDSDEVTLLFCSQHRNNRLELNCKDCRKVICLMCKVTNHETHTTQSVDEGLRFYLQETESLRNTLKNAEDIIKSTKDSAEIKMDTFNDSVDAKLEELKEYKDKLIEQIEEEYKELKKTITSQQENLNHYYEEIIKEERNKLTCIRRAQEWSRLVEDNAEGECLLTTLENKLIPQLKALCESLNQDESPMRIRIPEDVKEFLAVGEKYEQGVFLKGQITFIEAGSDTTVNPWYKVDHESLNTKVCSLTTAEWKYNLPDYCYSLLALDDCILAPLDQNTLHVISLSGELMMKKEYTVGLKCYSVHKLTVNELILGTSTGLYVLDSTTLDIKQQIYNRGEVAYPFVHDDEIVGLDSTNHDLIILMYKDSIVQSENHVKLHEWGKIYNYDSVVKCKDILYVVSYWSDKLYQYNVDGKVLTKNTGEGAIRKVDIECPRLLGVGKHGEVVWLEQHRKYLKIMKSDGAVVGIDLNGIKTNLRNVYVRDKKMWVIACDKYFQPPAIHQYHLS